MKRFIAIWILLSAGLNIWQMDRIRDLEEKKPMVIYKADNAGVEIFGIELMQSTGLKDKNGKEIFEGDIVRTTRFLGRADEIGGFYEYDKEFIGIVKQLEGSWVIDTGSDAVCLWTEIEENEIIGNIYENKEFGGRK
ncbi:TPA: YopX family protein [Streptococcus pneumoniae]